MDVGIEIAFFYRGIRTPHAGKKHQTLQDHRGVLQKNLQKTSFPPGKLYPSFRPGQFPQPAVVCNIRIRKPVVVIVYMIASADGADARRKFFIRKRFYKVIVCTAVESFHTVIQLSKGCDHNDRSRNAFVSGFLQNKKSVHGGQHAIQENQVIGILQNQIQPVASIHADFYVMVFFFQLKAQHFT